jgi:hypothetical protein
MYFYTSNEVVCSYKVLLHMSAELTSRQASHFSGFINEEMGFNPNSQTSKPNHRFVALSSPVDGLHSVWRHKVEADSDAVAHHGARDSAVLCSSKARTQQIKAVTSFSDGLSESVSKSAWPWAPAHNTPSTVQHKALKQHAGSGLASAGSSRDAITTCMAAALLASVWE